MSTPSGRPRASVAATRGACASRSSPATARTSQRGPVRAVVGLLDARGEPHRRAAWSAAGRRRSSRGTPPACAGTTWRPGPGRASSPRRPGDRRRPCAAGRRRTSAPCAASGRAPPSRCPWARAPRRSPDDGTPAASVGAVPAPRSGVASGRPTAWGRLRDVVSRAARQRERGDEQEGEEPGASPYPRWMPASSRWWAGKASGAKQTGRLSSVGNEASAPPGRRWRRRWDRERRPGHAEVFAQHTERRLPAFHSASWNHV